MYASADVWDASVDAYTGDGCTHVLDELVGLRVMERASNARDGDIAVRLVLHIQGHLVPLSIHDVYVPQRSARTAKYSGHRYTRPKAFSSGN